jgi:glutamate-ammonia-ligase adenylyltransferase
MPLPPAVENRLRLLADSSPDPEGVRAALETLEQRHPAAFQRLVHSTAALRYLIAVFAHSRFLTDEVLESPELIERLMGAGDMHRARYTDDYRMRLERDIGAGLPDAWPLARFRRRQILRILVRDVLGFGELSEITGELSSLADAMIEFVYDRIRDDLIARFGTPLADDGSEARFSVIALGKLGGEELNYSSDIDLMFLYSANGRTSGPDRITNKEFFQRAANQLTALLSTYTSEGLCYRVDLRLRPDGSLGEVCISLDGAMKYYASRARDWELQMMIKARVAAGDRATGRALLDFVEPRTYSTTLDFSAVEALSLTRERLNEKLTTKRSARDRGIREVDLKLDRGGIRDVEFLVQCLQRLHGGADAWVRHGGTLLALSRLHDKGLLSDAEYGGLASAYQFLRHLEHRLQFADDRQVHTLPREPAAIEKIARRMPQGGGSAEWLMTEIWKHFAQVVEIYERVVHSSAAAPEPVPVGRQASNIVRVLEQQSPALFAAIERAGLRRGFRAFEHFLERLDGDNRMERLESDAQLAARTLDLFEHSPYFAEEMIRTPELLDEIGCPPDPASAPHDATELRRWYRRQMLRIQSQSICGPEAIFDTLVRTSELADAVIARAYEIAVREAAGGSAEALHVIALGRLGMREFDLASDADLVFVLADSAAADMVRWTRVAERIIDLLTAYTGDGMLFAVDTRLRPNGGSGPLVQTESAVKDYFDARAEAWEGITYMKSRVVAGDAARADEFLSELQEIDWRRYGQGGRSRTDLRQMRLKLQKEQGASNPLKAGRGGYYDIDFLLMYLRLKSAGFFFKVLNTPERIEVLENMGHLDREEARFLQDAARFYRALDHGLRVLSGHAEGKLPASETQLELLAALLSRWTALPLSALSDIRSQTRAMFDRIFH